MKTATESRLVQKDKLLRILGVGFGVAVVIGGTIGVGILRSPGAVAAQLGSVWLIILVWLLGGAYALLGANFTAELATMLPKAGGDYLYARRAYGNYGGFVVGYSTWILNALALGYMAIVFGEYAVALFAPTLSNGVVIFSVSILILLTALNWIGLRTGSQTQKLTSLLKALALLGFVAACFIFGGQNDFSNTEQTVSPAPDGYFASFVAFILAFQLVLGTYAGWNAVVFFAEEDRDPTRNIPRSLFGGVFLIIIIYLLVNLALLYVLPVPQLAASKFAAADAMSLILGERSGQILTALALLSIIGIINALLMFVPRVVFALGRDGMFLNSAAKVNKGGTPVFALVFTALPAIVLASIGTFEKLLAISEFFAITINILLIGSLFILRRREPDLPRPYRTWGYPFTPLILLLISFTIFVGYIVSNPSDSLYAIAALAVSYPIFLLVKRKGTK
ncbi:MAG: amino acid permease [Acidobacteria bacterium]|nr:amino acid permease [Acidobacteriota bacterium]MCA1639555.1 amino acid permease [Acidobacteriota bacterium]